MTHIFEKIKNKRREIKELHQKQLESLPDHVSNSSLKKIVIPFTIIFSIFTSILIPLGILIYPIYLYEACGWAVILIYISVLPITFTAVLLVIYLTYKLSKLAIIRFFITKRFDIKLLIAGLLTTIILVFIAEYWMIYNAFHI